MNFKDIPLLLEEKFENVYNFEQPYSRAPFRHDWLFPPDLPNPRPLRPVPLSNYKAAGARLPAEDIERQKDIRYYPTDIPIPDFRLLKVLFSKNTFEALRHRNLPTIAPYRMLMDANTRRQIEDEVIVKTKREFQLFKQGRYADITIPDRAWADETVMNQLVNAEDINAFWHKIKKE